MKMLMLAIGETSSTGDDYIRDDVVKLNETALPYMMDNVVVLSTVADDDNPAVLDWEMIGQMVRALIPGAAFEVDGTGQVIMYTNHDDAGLPIG